MELLQLQYFTCVAKHESVTKAAEELHISQPSLSNSIIRLEKELGAQLFERKNRKMYLTNYGLFFLSNTRKILDLVNTCKLPAPTDQKARITLAFQNYNDKLFSIVQEFYLQNPNVEFNIYGSTLNEPFPLSSFDFIIGNSNVKLPIPLNSLLIESRGYYVVVPKNHQFASEKSIHLEQLRHESFVFLRDDHGNFEEAYNFCIESGFVPNSVLITNHSYYKNRFLSKGNCFGIIPTGWRLPYSLAANTVTIPLEGFEKYTDIMFYWSDDIERSFILIKFLEFVRQHLEP